MDSPALVAILEDDSGRAAEMRTCLSEVLPSVESIFFADANEMIDWLRQHLRQVVLISLDHDLPLRDVDGQPTDCGTGRQVADFLAALPPTCPVIVHSSNEHYAPGMLFALRDAGWPCCRVYPRDDLTWIRGAWIEQVGQYLRDGWLGSSGHTGLAEQPKPTPQPPSADFEISHDLLPNAEGEFSFVEGTYRLPGRSWQVMIFTKKDVSALQHRLTTWPSGVTGIIFHMPMKHLLNKAYVERAMAEVFGTQSWVEAKGPDSMLLR